MLSWDADGLLVRCRPMYLKRSVLRTLNTQDLVTHGRVLLKPLLDPLSCQIPLTCSAFLQEPWSDSWHAQRSFLYMGEQRTVQSGSSTKALAKRTLKVYRIQ